MPGLYALLLTLSIVATFVYKLRVDGIFACPASGYKANAYLTDCNASAYGDYDHGAFWFGLEPQACQAAAGADVLLVGSSRLQFALSTPNTAEWFTGLGLRHYLLGFSHSETVAFFDPLISKLRPRARAYVINVDRFFDDRVSPPTEQILQGRDIRQRYEEKRSWQFLHKALCAALPMACGNALAVYRTRDTGAWQREGSRPFDDREVSDGPASDAERWEQFADLGARFLAQLPVDRSCVILTIVPTVATKRDEAKAIAARLGFALAAPRVEGLRTFDGSHLDEASAARWSAAFLQEAGPQLRRCVGGTRAPKG